MASATASEEQQPEWLRWARHLQAIAQNGITYAKNQYDLERYMAVRRIAAEVLAQGWGSNTGLVELFFEREGGHATPKVDTRAAVFREGRILLVKEIEDGGWTLPGGWADVGDTPSAACEREVREESGYQVRATKLAMALDRDKQGHPFIPFHAYKLFFLCELLGGEATTSIETDGVDWFAEDALPPLSLSRVTERQIHRLFEHERHPEWGADFD